MTDTDFTPSGPAFPSARPVSTRDEQRREAMLDADLNVARIADALVRFTVEQSALMHALVDAVERFASMLEPEPDDEQRTGEPEPEPPIDAAPDWAPVKGGRAVGIHTGALFVVDRIFDSEGETWAHVVDEDGVGITVPVSNLEAPR